MLKNLTRYIKNIKNKAIKYESLDANGDNIDRYQIVLKRVVIWSIAVVLLSSGLTGVSAVSYTHLTLPTKRIV